MEILVFSKTDSARKSCQYNTKKTFSRVLGKERGLCQGTIQLAKRITRVSWPVA